MSFTTQKVEDERRTATVFRSPSALVHNDKELKEAYDTVTGESIAAFGKSAILVEKFLEKIRHIEYQLARDKHGEIQADSFADLNRYLDTLENYLGLLYRERAEKIFSDVIERGWQEADVKPELDASFHAELEQKAKLAKKLESLNRDLLQAKESADIDQGAAVVTPAQPQIGEAPLLP